MADFLNTSLSGLLTFQRALATTSHNVANVGTEGYNRQRVDLAAVPGVGSGGNIIGQGVEIASVSRVLDQFQVNQVRSNVAQQSRLDAFTQMSSSLDRLLASSDTGLSQPLQEFFNALQTVADTPASIPARQVALGQANALADRVQSLQQRLEAQNTEVTARMGAAVQKVNALAESVASLNTAIFEAGAANGGTPNDLMDQRDLVLQELSELVAVDVVTQNDGAVNIFVGSGQALVLGNQASRLTVINGDFGTATPELGLVSSAGVSTISVDGGEIGGLMNFRREMLDPSMNSLGQMAIALTETLNAQHSVGMDLQGNLGGDFFAVGEPQVLPRAQNTGSGDFSVAVTDVSNLTNADYLLAYDGANYTLTRRDTGTAVALAGSGTVGDPFVADGVSIVVNSAPAAGDQFLIRPTYGAAVGFGVQVTSPEGIAAAFPIRSAAELANTGTGAVVGEEVLDPANPNLLNTVTIEFIDPNNFSINGAGSFAYSPGGPIDINGWRLRIDGTPEAGDQFVVRSNAGGVGDNRNALELASVLERDVLAGGTTSVRESYGNLVSEVSTVTRRAEINLTAQNAITEQSINDQLAVSGVNLDEEAANMLRYQQAYQATAQLISVADVLFQTMLSAVRR